MNQLKLYDYNLPDELIAYYPSPERDSSRMLVLDRESGKIESKNFSEICGYFSSGDCLVLNNTQVIKGRLYGKKEITNANVEIMLISALDSKAKIWSCLIKPGKRVKPGTKVFLTADKLSNEIFNVYFIVTSAEEDGTYVIEFGSDNVYELMEQFGHIPLPPYIKRGDDFSDTERYQTVYSKIKGAVAAPTADSILQETFLIQFQERELILPNLLFMSEPGLLNLCKWRI